jgi:hypothetical protein
MAKSRRIRRSRKSRGRKTRMRGGQAPVNYSNPGPMNLNLAQGKQFAGFHREQHGGAALNTSGAYPGIVEQPTLLPANLVASAKLTGLDQAFDYIKQFGPSSDNPNLRGGRRGRGSRKSRKSRKGRKQRGGVLVRWGGGRKTGRKSRKGRKASRKGRKTSRKGRKASRKGRSRRMRGGSYAEMRFPMPVGEETKMLIPASLQAQAGLNPEWDLYAKNPNQFNPKL